MGSSQVLRMIQGWLLQALEFDQASYHFSNSRKLMQLEAFDHAQKQTFLVEPSELWLTLYY